MTKKLVMPIFLLATVLAIMAFTPSIDIDGHWRGQFMGQYDVHYEFKVDGTTLTGKKYNIDGSISDLKDGKIEGNKITYTTSIAGENVPVAALLHDDIMTLTFTVQGYEVVVDLKRAEK